MTCTVIEVIHSENVNTYVIMTPMNSEQIKPKEGQNETSRFFEGQVEQGRNQDVQLGCQQQGVGGANKSFKIATIYSAYGLLRALKVLASATDTGKVMIALDKDAFRITTFDWFKTKAAVLKVPFKEVLPELVSLDAARRYYIVKGSLNLLEYNPNAIRNYYIVDAWELYEAIDGMISSDENLYGKNVTIGVEGRMDKEATVYVEIDGRRERLNAHWAALRRVIPRLKPAASVVWVYVKPLLGALTRARRTGAEYVDIAITPNGLRIKGGKYIAELGGGMGIPGVIEGRYPMSVVYDVISHSVHLLAMRVYMTAGKLLYFNYTTLDSLTAYIMPVY